MPRGGVTVHRTESRGLADSPRLGVGCRSWYGRVLDNGMAIGANWMSFERGDIDKLETCLTQYCSSTDLQERHAENALKYALDQLSWSNIAEGSIRLYENS